MMDPRLKLFLALAGSILLSSCWVLMPNCHRRFTVHEDPFGDGQPNDLPRLNGIYVSDESRSAFYFFPHGLVKEFSFSVPESGYLSNPQETINRMEMTKRYPPSEDWGGYSIDGKELVIQRFNYHQTEICKRSIFEYHGVMVNDTTFIISSYNHYWFSDTATTCHFVYRFYPTDFKPDDSKIWFEKKRWYLRDRDPSRAR